MTDSFKLAVVKSVHTLIWVFFNLVLFYLFFAAFTDNIGVLFWIGIGVIAIECVILVLNRWTCPLTPIARRYSDSTAPNFDIYLPLLVAKYNKEIYSVLLVVLVGVFLLRVTKLF